ncbi:hypothetical protein E1200_21665 [Actinomadura sp. GC306]|uniref:hypothetical protein n=1 Tax=Actinomadura sp. GC306 TaxID=2530367 RepID=UPI001045F2A9|nr:hypothetical protein [Actinomadura sp. GC306]TDC63727.1 hypothetical protein E1200_21665 [Actinomadura sp. GC306]
MRPSLALRIAAAALLGAGLAAGPATPAAAAEPAPLKAAPAPWLWPRSGLEAVSATGPDDVWAAGYQGYQGIDWSIPMFGAGTIHVLPPKPAVVRWNGSSWRTYDPPGAGGDAVLKEIKARTPSDVWATGVLRPHGQAAPYLAHWNGTRWQQVQGPAGNCAPGDPAPDSTGAWFSCGGGLYRLQDGQWTVQDAGRPPGACCVGVRDISVLSDDAAWAAATWGLLRWDGQTWSEVPGFDGAQFASVLAVSADEVWATGSRSTDGPIRDPFMVRWDGVSWQELPAPPHGERLVKTGDGTLWSTRDYFGRLYRLDGSSWTQVTQPTPADGRVTDGTAVPGTPALWLVGKTPNVPVVMNNG